MMRCTHLDDPDPSGRPVTALGVEARFVLTGLRGWLSTHRSGDEAPNWRKLFALAELPPEAAAAFGSFMAIVQQTMRRALDLRCCQCPQVGEDEEAMLRVVAALQRDDRLGALEDISDWLETEGVMPALGAAGRFAALLGSNDVWLAGASAGAPVQDRLAADRQRPVQH